jgi:hypothetical protein
VGTLGVGGKALLGRRVELRHCRSHLCNGGTHGGLNGRLGGCWLLLQQVLWLVLQLVLWRVLQRVLWLVLWRVQQPKVLVHSDSRGMLLVLY